MYKDPIDIRKEEILKKREEEGNSNSKSSLVPIIASLLIIGVTLVLVVKVMIPFANQTLITTVEDTHEAVNQQLVGDFEEGDKVTYTITNKSYRGLYPNFTIVNTETKDVFNIEVTEDMYYHMIVGQEMESINSKDNKSVKIIETERISVLNKIEY